MNTLFNNSYYSYTNDKILNLMYEYHNELSITEIKKLLKRIKTFDDNEIYYKLFDLAKERISLMQFVDLNTKFREIDVIDYVNLLQNVDFFDIFNALKSITSIYEHKLYFELLFEHNILNSNINDFYLQLICIDKFMYKVKNDYANNIIDVINMIFIENNLDITYIVNNYNYEIHSLYTNRLYKDYNMKNRFEKHIEKLKLLKRKTIINNLI